MINPEVSHDREIIGDIPERSLELGIIGHENVDDAYNIGTNGGPILARVQLFRGRDYTQPLKADRMQGSEILARVTSGFSNLPPKGTEVLVAFPGGMSTAPGAGVIIAQLSRVTSAATYGNLQEEELCIHPGDADNAINRILLKKDGSINLFTRQGNDPSGKGMTIAIDAVNNAIRILNGSGYGIIIDGSGIILTAKDSALTLGSDGNIKMIAKQQNQVDGATVVLGSVAVPGVNSAIHGPAGIAGIASLKVLIE